MAYNEDYRMRGYRDSTRYYNPETGRLCSYEEYSYIMNRMRGYHHSLSSGPTVIQPKQQVTQPSVESKSENIKNKLLLLL